jgi:hypothetical protein
MASVPAALRRAATLARWYPAAMFSSGIVPENKPILVSARGGGFAGWEGRSEISL